MVPEVQGASQIPIHIDRVAGMMDAMDSGRDEIRVPPAPATEARRVSDQLDAGEDGEQEQHARVEADRRQRDIDDDFRHPLQQVEPLRRGEIKLLRTVMHRMIGPKQPHLMHHAMEEIGPELGRQYIGRQGPPGQRNAPVAVPVGREGEQQHNAGTKGAQRQIIDRGSEHVGDRVLRQQVALNPRLPRGPPFEGAEQELDAHQQKHENDDAVRPTLQHVLNFRQSDRFINQLFEHRYPLHRPKPAFAANFATSMRYPTYGATVCCVKRFRVANSRCRTARRLIKQCKPCRVA